MGKSLLVVESPTKVKTIKKYLGTDFIVMASMGHVMDLPKKSLGIDIRNNFEPTYDVIETRKKTVADIKAAAASVENIYLAPDPDREGEAIAWHIANAIGKKGKGAYRVLFNDLTKKTILASIAKPLKLDYDKYEAQQTRRILDRLVGYQISPVLWDKVQKGLSAGRVQSVAVRIVVDREREILNFKPEEYWNMLAQFEGPNPPPFGAKLFKINGMKAKIGNAAEAEALAATITQCPGFLVDNVEKKEAKRSAPPPFTTSKLQQEAARWLKYPAKKTMMIAQKLYEGIELGPEGSVGLITYMRTDSVRTAEDALDAVRKYIKDNYAPENLPAKANEFKVSAKAQDGHEAIRPTSMSHKPQDIKKYLADEQYLLYRLIWDRFVASQMTQAVFDQTIIDIAGANCIFRANGQVPKFPGFTVLYTEGVDEKDKDDDDSGTKSLPDICKGDSVKLLKLDKKQKFTQPPPRFTEASLVRELEDKGIGRPSTYASILSTIQERTYVELDKGKFRPTGLGNTVTDMLVQCFPTVLDLEFTADMESKLDAIEDGKKKRVETLQEFYAVFKGELDKVGGSRSTPAVPVDAVCDLCGKPMAVRTSKHGPFLGCTGYPECKGIKRITIADGNGGSNGNNNTAHGANENVPAVPVDAVCDLCGKPMAVRAGKYGPFLGCTGYPECKGIKRISNDQGDAAPKKPPVLSKEVCDLCGKPMAVRTSKHGPFLGCTGYPECKSIKKISKGKKN